MNKKTAGFALTFIVGLWGLSFALTKPLLEYIGIFTFLTYRFVTGGLVLSMVLGLKKSSAPDRNVLRDGFIAGVLLFAVFVFHTFGLKYTSIANNAFIVGSAVIFIPFVRILAFKEKQTRVTWIQVVLSAAGLALITAVGTGGGLNFGDTVSLFGTVILSFYTLFIERRINRHSPLMFTAIQLLTVGILSLIAMMALETPVLPRNAFDWTSITVMGFVLTGFAYVIGNICQKHIDALGVSIIYTLEPFFAALFGWLMLAESMSAESLAGAALIFLSMLVPGIAEARRSKRQLEYSS